MGGFAWVTLATNDSYSLGALILAHSLKQAGTNAQLAVLVTPGVTSSMKEKLATVFNLVQEVNILDSKDEANLRLLKRPELGVTFTKLHCWRLTQFEKCVFLDADTMVLQNCDELFEREELSAAPDVGWPDCFNSGVFVFRPSNETYDKLVQFALEKGSFDGGDQGLLNLYFSDWAHKDISKHLPFIYNMCSTACYSYLPAFKQFGGNAKIIHFIGPAKPWLQYFDSETRKVSPSGGMQHLQHILQKWWDLFCEKIHPILSKEMPPRNTKQSSSVILSRSLWSNNPEIHDFSSPDDYQNVWDPWEEYDNRQTGNVSVDFQNQHLVMEHIIHTIEAQDKIDKSNKDCVHQQHNQCDIHTERTSVDHDKKSFHYHNESFPHNSQDSESHNTNANINTDHPPLSLLLPNTPETHDSSNMNDVKVDVVSPISVTHSPDPDLTDPDLPAPFEATAETILHASHDDEPSDTGLAGAFAQLTLGAPRSAEQMALEDHLRRQGWEVGNIDYLGRDSFENIWSKICETLAEPTETPKEAAATPTVTPAATPAATPVKTKATKEPSLTASELQSTEQIATEEVVTEKVVEKEAEAPQQTEVPKEAAPDTETTQLAEQVVPTTQVLPPTPTSPLGLEVCPIKTPEASPLALPVTEVSSPPPKPEETPAVASVASTECPLPPKVEAAECPMPAKVEAEPATPTECPLPTKVKDECPLPAKIEPAVCPLPPKPESPVKVDSPPAVTTECSLPPKVEARPEPASVECSLPQPTEPTIAVCSLPPSESPVPAKTEPSLAANVAEEKTPVETPTLPETPEVVAFKVPESTPKAQEPSTAKAPEPSSPKPESTPTPPPRKGSGGSKKSPKSKK